MNGDQDSLLILALSDIHGRSERLPGIAVAASEADLVLVAGDLTDFGGADQLEEVLAALGEHVERLVAVPGNCDKRAARERLEELGLSSDGRLVERAGVLVAGVGGGGLRTGLTPYERREDELSTALFAALSQAGDRSDAEGRIRQPIVVLSHHPPKDSGADLRRGSAVGSASLRAILDEAEPLLWVCGHIHESPSARRMGRSLIVNPGPAAEGRYALIRLARSGEGAWRAQAELR